MERIVVGNKVSIRLDDSDDGFMEGMTVNYVPMDRDDKWIVTDDYGTYYIENCLYVYKENRSK